MSSTVTNATTMLLIEVDDFNNDSEELGSYLRLGAVPQSVQNAYNAIVAGGNDYSALVNNGEDLACQVLGFVDDTRDRGDGDFLTLTNAERQAESDLLHTKGGWRDHTDGNRITTTLGDKVEVIGGNYKLLVLGREQWNGNGGVGLHHESSGGITYHYDEIPGQIIDVRRTQDDGGTWQVIEECSTGHFVARYHGVDKDWHTGGDLKTRIGSLGAYKVKTKGANWDDVKDDDGFSSDSDFNKPEDASHQAKVDWPGDSTLPNVREEIFADTVIDKVRANIIEDYDGSSDHFLEKRREYTYATTIDQMEVFVGYVNVMGGKVGGGASELWKGFFLEFFGTLALTVKLGIFFDWRYGWCSQTVNLPILSSQLNIVLKRLGLKVGGLNFEWEDTLAGLKFRVSTTGIYELKNTDIVTGTLRKRFTARQDIN